MKQTMNRVVSVVIALVLTLSIHSKGQASSTHNAVMPENVVNIAFFYKPPNNSDALTVSQNFNTVILTRLDESFRDQLVANGFKSTIPQYLRFEAIMDPGDCTSTPLRSQVAYKPGDFCAISRDHPDWFLLDALGKRLGADKIGDNYYMMDPGNQEWRAFWLSRALELQTQYGWSGLFLDNVEGSLSKRKNTSGLPAKYVDDISYKAAIRGFLEYLYLNYAKANNRPMLANIATLKERVTWYEYLPYLDGAMTERWGVDWSYTGYVDKATWEEDMLMAEQTQSLGKNIIMVAPGSETDYNRQNFAFASYLLVSNGKAAFRYSNSSTYRYVWFYSNYQTDLGSPLGPRYLSGNLWRRDFAKGSVTVDPVNHIATISTNPSTPINTSTPVSTATSAASPTPIAPTNTPITVAPTNTPTTLPPTAASTAQATVTSIPPTGTSISPTETSILPTATVVLPEATAAPVQVSSETVYNDNNTALIYSSGWADVYKSKALQGSYKVTRQVGSSATLKFSGQSVSIIYATGKGFGSMAVYIDNQQVAVINQKTSQYKFQKKWSYPGTLSAGMHELKLVSTGPQNAPVTLDAIIVR